MGVPGFNTWFARNHRHAYVSYFNRSWDHVYIDMASILHSTMKTGMHATLTYTLQSTSLPIQKLDIAFPCLQHPTCPSFTNNYLPAWIPLWRCPHPERVSCLLLMGQHLWQSFSLKGNSSCWTQIRTFNMPACMAVHVYLALSSSRLCNMLWAKGEQRAAARLTVSDVHFCYCHSN